MDGSSAFKLNPETGFLVDPQGQHLCATLEGAGYLAFFVGGCVRNAILGTATSDVDLASDARPQDIVNIATKAGFRAIPTGIDHGTVTVVVDDTAFEVTTFRRDVATDGRRAVVAFSDNIEEDARRRDFTMNALYADRNGVVHDPLGGLQDTLNRRVRFIEDPVQRIREDYLRILRFFRFSAFYADPDKGWDAVTLSAISENLDGLETLSAERTGAEMLKLLSAPDPVPALAVMEQTGVLHRILPGARIAFAGPYVHLESISGVLPDPVGRLAALGGMDVDQRLRLSRADQKKRQAIQEYSTSALGPRALGHLLGFSAGFGAIALRAAMAGHPLQTDTVESIESGTRAEFPLSARDLPTLSGPDLGQHLKLLKSKWLASELTKSKQDLLGA